jgi:serine/threonine protein kinase
MSQVHQKPDIKSIRNRRINPDQLRPEQVMTTTSVVPEDFVYCSTIGVTLHSCVELWERKDDHKSFAAKIVCVCPPDLPPSARKEADVSKRFDHEFLISEEQLYEYPVGGVQVGVSEWIPLGSLIVNRKLVPTHKVTILLSIGVALQYLHSRGSFHGFLKPSNIMLLLDGGARLSHFGFCDFATRSARFEREYSSPESVCGELGASADVWSFGVLLFELLTGHRACRLLKRLKKGKQAEFPPQLKVHRLVQSLLSKCLEVNATRRATMEYVLKSFQEARFNLMAGVDLVWVQRFRARHFEEMNALPRVTLPGRRPGVIPLSGKETDLHRAVLRRDMAAVLRFSNHRLFQQNGY